MDLKKISSLVGKIATISIIAINSLVEIIQKIGDVISTL